MNVINHTNWLLLVFNLPTDHATARMRVWRALKGLGSAALRDGVSLLPETADTRAALVRIADEIRSSGGEAHCLRLAPDTRQSDEFRARFDRSVDYAALLEEARHVNGQLLKDAAQTPDKAVRSLRRQLEALTATDYFPGEAQAHGRQVIDNLEAALAAHRDPGEPHFARHGIARLAARDHIGRLWATRQDLWVDRVASAWLIRRHIDRKARFVWLRRIKDCPHDALSFDFNGATFSHVGHRVTFETLLASFGLEEDAALLRLGGVIHALDAGGVTPAEAAGLAALLKGIKAGSTDDDDFLKRATPVFDALHTSFKEEGTA